jgi:hypothetical protein
MGAAESGNGKLARAVDSVGSAIGKNGKWCERVANLALRYRLIYRAGLSNVEQQTAYRKLLTQAQRDRDRDGSEILDGVKNDAENNEGNIVSANTPFTPDPQCPLIEPHVEFAEEINGTNIVDDSN